MDKYLDKNNSLKSTKTFSEANFTKGDDLTYTPPIAREEYQLSIWKVDAHAVYKIKDQYFTPQSDLYYSADFSDLGLFVGSDGKTIMLAQTGLQISKRLFIIFDFNTLKIMSEQVIDITDEDVKQQENKSPPSEVISRLFLCIDHNN